MGRHTSIAIRMAFITIFVFGVLYPLVMTGLAQVFFPRQANGSLVIDHGVVIGSELIAQSFTAARYFHPRPSAAGKGYDAVSSGGSNLGPTSKALMSTVQQRVKKETRHNPGLHRTLVPVDMVTASGSGLDPDISLANAYAQLPRVAKARGISEARVRVLLDANRTGRSFGILGEPRINVLQINRALDASSVDRK